MFDFYDSNYSDEFKQRLQDARCKKKFSQQDFADCLEDNDRSRVANWESKKSTTVPKTQDIPGICKILDIDPNYLFGFSTITNENDKAISEQIHLSTDNIKLLRNDTSVSNFINYLMTTPKFHSLLNQLNHICVNGFFSESIETTFSTFAIQKLEKAFHRFSCEVFSIDRNEHTFVPYVKKVFPWNRKNSLSKTLSNPLSSTKNIIKCWKRTLFIRNKLLMKDMKLLSMIFLKQAFNILRGINLQNWQNIMLQISSLKLFKIMSMLL